MKKSYLDNIWKVWAIMLLFSIYTTSLFAGKTSCSSTDDFTTVYGTMSDGDTMVLTTPGSSGSYNWGVTAAIALGKSVTIISGTTQSDKPIVKTANAFTVTGAGVTYSKIEFRGIEFYALTAADTTDSRYFLDARMTTSTIGTLKLKNCYIHGYSRSVVRADGSSPVITNLEIDSCTFNDNSVVACSYPILGLKSATITSIRITNSTFFNSPSNVITYQGTNALTFLMEKCTILECGSYKTYTYTTANPPVYTVSNSTYLFNFTGAANASSVFTIKDCIIAGKYTNSQNRKLANAANCGVLAGVDSIYINGTTRTNMHFINNVILNNSIRAKYPFGGTYSPLTATSATYDFSTRSMETVPYYSSIGDPSWWKVYSVSINESTVPIGNTQLTAEIIPSDAPDKSITWSLRPEDAAVASINSTTGLLTTTAIGSIVVMATPNSNASKAVSKTITISTGAIAVTGITISGATKVNEGSSISLSAEVTPTNAADKTVTWSLRPEDAAYASINSTTGVLVGIAKGQVVAKATANDGSGISATYTVTIVKPVSSIEITGESVVAATKSITLGTKTLPVDATDTTVTWSLRTQDAAYAAINSSTGVLSATAAGTVIATATANDGSGISATKTITITNAPVLVTGISISGYAAILKGAQGSYMVSVVPANADNKTVTWSLRSEDAAYASINASTGVLTAISEGTVVITATANDGSGIVATKSVNVVASAILVESVTISGPSEVSRSQKVIMQATITPENATTPALEWSIPAAYSAYATINATTGELTPFAFGTIIVNASATDGSGKFASILVTIGILKVSSITLPSATDGTLGSGFILQATVLPVGADNSTLLWSLRPEDAAIATINSSTGEILANAYGDIVVTAKSTDGSDVSASSQVTIKSVAISGDNSLTRGNAIQLSATTLPLASDASNIVWSLRTEDAAKATISNTGLLTSVAAGEVVVTATIGSTYAKATKTITILPVFVSSLSISGATTVLNRQSITLSSVALPAEADNKNVIWSIDYADAAKAVISSEGVFTAVAPGNATVIATAADGSGVKASYLISITPITITSIALRDTSVDKTKSVTPKITVSPANADNQIFAWSLRAEDEEYAIINPQTGYITGKKAGTIVVTASTTDGSNLTATANVTISPLKVSSLLIAGASSVAKGATLSLTASVMPTAADDPSVTWGVSDVAKATIDANGLLTALDTGKVTVTATSNNVSSVTATKVVTISESKVSQITVSGPSSLTKGESTILTASVSPAIASNQSIYWSLRSEDAAYAEINAYTGLLNTYASGTVVVSANATDGSGVVGTLTITINPVLVSKIVITSDKSVKVGGSLGLSASVTPSNADNKMILWSIRSQDSAFVSVDDTLGIITGLADGKVVVTASATDGSGLSASDTISVYTAVGTQQVEASGVTVFPVPVGNMLNVTCESELVANVSIYSFSGVEMLAVNVIGSKVEVVTSQLPSGAYLIRVTTLSGKVVTKMITKL
jgi:uncharacterized protein YjdB